MKNLNNLMETINQFGLINVADEPSYLDAICEYVMMNGVHSDWNAVNECMRFMMIGDKSVKELTANDDDEPSIENYLGRIYPMVSRLYNIWSYPLYTEDERYSNSKEEITSLLPLIIDLRNYINKINKL